MRLTTVPPTLVAGASTLPAAFERAFGVPTLRRLHGDADVYAAYLKCSACATYNGRKLDAALFGDQKVGEAACHDTFEIFNIIISFNNARFFPVASSASSTPPPAA